MVDGAWLMVNGETIRVPRRIEKVEDMPVYQKLYGLAIQLEAMTRGFQQDFRWLRNQILRASESLQSLFRCRREAREVMTHLRYAIDVSLLNKPLTDTVLNEYEESMRQLGALIASIEEKIRQRGKAKPGLVREPDDLEYGSGLSSRQPLTINH